MNSLLNHENHEFDVCVVGGGMAGICAAIAAARNGAKTALIHDRPVLGGNASSEVRMWICGAHGKGNKETGILEEIQLDNQRFNPSLSYSIWDAILWGKVAFQPNLTPFLNASCLDATMDDDRITKVTAWQLTSQTFHTISARLFIDCSGDSILAPLTGAHWVAGREARSEWDEDIQPITADTKTMGNTLLIQLRRTEEPQPFEAPPWAYKFTSPEDLPFRMHGVQATNFWWMEIGGLQDTIKDAEPIRDELMRITYGVWDYIKNHSPEKDESENWALEWVGSLPGKRENRRYVGDHVLTQNDVRAGGIFEDIVAYGGWSMDDHHPAGLYYPGRPTLFHAAPSPYGIPYRCLYSRNIENLLFAGRNISVTHAALSSTRVMATCALLGQATGTAAALCISESKHPRQLSHGDFIHKLQTILMDDDCWLPGKARPVDELAKTARLCGNGDVSSLIDGHDRSIGDADHSWTGALGEAIEFHWEKLHWIAGVRLTFDSNLNNEKRMPCSYPQKGNRCIVPPSLIKDFRLETLDESGVWSVAAHIQGNFQRLVRVEIGASARALRLIPESTWGAPQARIFAFEPLGSFPTKIPVTTVGPHFSEIIAGLDPRDLIPPESGFESDTKSWSAA
jgi:hypothetical protein